MTVKRKQLSWPRPLKWFVKHNWHKHPFVIPVTTLLVLFFVAIGMAVSFNDEPVIASDSHLVVLSHDKKQETLPTRAKTVGEFLGKVGIELHEGDVVEPSKETEIIDQKFRINVYRARPVVLVDGDHKTFAFSAATTPRSVASQAGVQVYPEDTIESTMETDFIRDATIGEKVVIARATPANLNLYGTPVPVRTHAKTVGELLKEKKIDVSQSAQVSPAPDTPITAQLQIFVVREGSTIQLKEEVIPMQTETIEDPRLSFGTTVVRQQGSAGKRVVAYQIDVDKDGHEIGRKEIQSVVAAEPIKQIIARGKVVYIPADKESVMAAAGIAPSDYPYVNYIVGRESGWNAAAHNASGAFGLCQALPGSKMASAGSDWASNPVTQLKWCSSYAARKGGWQASYNLWITQHWW